MKNDQFLMVLPSNSSMGYFAENAASSYITELPHAIYLHGEWEVALSEIQFPSTFYHVNLGENELRFVDIEQLQPKEDDEDVLTTTAKIKKVAIPPGIYKNIGELIGEINNVCKDIGAHFKLTLAPGGKIEFSIGCNDLDCKLFHHLNVSDNLLRILGCGEKIRKPYGPYFKKVKVINPDSENSIYFGIFARLGKRNEHDTRITMRFLTPEAYSLARGIPDKLFVYCDICEPYITGDVQTPLLRIVPVEVHGADYVYGENQVQHFSPMHYIPLRQMNFRRVEINIKDEFGEKVPFQSGTSSVTLHFRRYQ